MILIAIMVQQFIVRAECSDMLLYAVVNDVRAESPHMLVSAIVNIVRAEGSNMFPLSMPVHYIIFVLPVRSHFSF